MKKILLLLLFSSIAFAQVPFSKKNENNSFAIKICPYVNLFDGGVGTITGIEKGFKNHSIGMKFIYNYFTPHGENASDKSYEPIDYTKDKDISAIFEYKYYLDIDMFREHTSLSPYFSLVYKTGKRIVDNDLNYPHDFYHRETKYNYVGPAIGTLIFLGQSKKWSLDTQFSYLFGKKEVYTEYVNPIKVNLNENFNTDYLRFEIMLCYNIN